MSYLMANASHNPEMRPNKAPMLGCRMDWQLKRVAQIGFRAGCLVSVLAPVVALVLYPRVNWIFPFALIGVALIVIQILAAKEPTPQEVADLADRILSGTYGDWDIDDYEHLNPRNPALKDLWRSTMSVGGLPEEWVRLDESKQSEIREIVRRLRQMGPSQSR